jgi:hypothetical protein
MIGIDPSAVLYFSLLIKKKKKRKETLFEAGGISISRTTDAVVSIRKLHVRLQEHSLFDVIIIVKWQ